MSLPLTRAHAPEIEDAYRRTPDGMAHWAGSGPEGRTCRECAHFTNEGYFAASSALSPNGLKNGRCRKYRALTTRDGAKFKHGTPACKWFAESENPPSAVFSAARCG